MGSIDDQHRNTNMNEKDHLVGQLTRCLLIIGKMTLDDDWLSGIFMQEASATQHQQRFGKRSNVSSTSRQFDDRLIQKRNPDGVRNIGFIPLTNSLQ